MIVLLVNRLFNPTTYTPGKPYKYTKHTVIKPEKYTCDSPVVFYYKHVS
jgi:hypothetical protein